MTNEGGNHAYNSFANDEMNMSTVEQSSMISREWNGTLMTPEEFDAVTDWDRGVCLRTLEWSVNRDAFSLRRQTGTE